MLLQLGSHKPAKLDKLLGV